MQIQKIRLKKWQRKFLRAGSIRSLKRNGEQQVMRISKFDTNVENAKRRGALMPVDAHSRLFFERVVSAKKIRELIFITKAKAKGR